jgi:hypothetical protein
MRKSKDQSEVFIGIVLFVVLVLFFGLMFAGCVSIQYIIRDILTTTHFLK